jgi:hypothetical protein
VGVNEIRLDHQDPVSQQRVLILEPREKKIRNIGKFRMIRRIILNQSRGRKRLQDLNPGMDSPVRGLKEPQDQAKKSPNEKASSPESIRQPCASKDLEWMGLNNPDLDRIPMTTTYGGPTLIVDQVKPLISMDPGNLVDVAQVVVDTTAKLKEQNVDYMSLLKKQ